MKKKIEQTFEKFLKKQNITQEIYIYIYIYNLEKNEKVENLRDTHLFLFLKEI